MALFEKGNPGKPKGATNKLTKTVKETVLSVFTDLQGDEKNSLLAFAKKYPRDFYQIAAKLIPSEVNATIEEKVIIVEVDGENENSPTEME